MREPALPLSLALQGLALASSLPFGSGGGRREEKGREKACCPRDVDMVEGGPLGHQILRPGGFLDLGFFV